MTKDEALRLYRDMLLIRRFEERCAQVYVEGKIGGFLHLYIGQEAVAVGAMSLLRPDDYFLGSYRDHGYALARGTDPRPLMAELYGRSTGISRGKGGSMHFYDVPSGNFGGDGIVGGHLPVAAGKGYAIRLRQTDQVVICFFGDGAVNEGAFHESLNVSALGAGRLRDREQPLRHGHLARPRPP
jgi:pyruvate dehydrogenase E1 component alpha subunit